MKRTGLTANGILIGMVVSFITVVGLLIVVVPKKTAAPSEVTVPTNAPVSSDANPQVVQNKNLPVAASPTGTISGQVWMERGDGETVSIALEEVFALPADLPTNDKWVQLEVKELVKNLRSYADVSRYAVSQSDVDKNLKSQYIALANSMDAVANRFEKDMQTPNIDTSAISEVVQTFVADDVDTARRANEQSGDHSETPDVIYKNDSHWTLMVSHAVAKAMTGRTGDFSIQNLPVGHYLVVCRTYRPANYAVVYWAQPITVTADSTAKIDLNNSNGHVMSY